MCDHSPRLRDGRLQLQWEEIDALNEALAPFRILKGIEVNIRANGELDVADDILEQLDWVMASVHTSFDKDPTERVLHAMESPHVDCIGHLTSRRIGVRNPSTIEVEKVVEARARDGHVPRDQLAARPARPARRERAARRRGRGDARDLERRALDEGAPLRRSRRRPGAARLADEGPDPEHAPVAGDREAAQVSFREDGVAAVDWVASYFERLREFPVLAQVEPGELRSRLPASPPETAEPFANVLRDLDEILLPAITHWQSPRFFAYFANTGSEPGVLAELLSAGLNQVGILWRTSPALQELEEVTLDWLAQLLGLPGRPARPHRGHRLDLHDGRARRGAAGEAGRARRRHLRARALVGREGVPAARARGAAGAGRRRVPAAPGRARPHGRLRRRRDDRNDLDELGRSGRRDRGPRGGRRRLAARRRRLRRLRRGVPRAARRTSPAGSAPTRSSSTRTSGC